MAGEFTKPSSILPAIVGQIANPDEYNQNIGGQSQDALVCIDTNGAFADGDIGDETLGTNGTLINNIKLREGGFLKFYNASGVFQNNVNLGQGTDGAVGQTFLPKQITISNGTDTQHDIDLTAGNFQFDDGTGQAVLGAMTKQIDAVWVAGTDNGGLDTGTVAIDSTYHLFAIYNPTSGISDALFSASLSPTMPSGYTKKRKIASLVTDGSSNIRNGSYIFNRDGSYKCLYSNSILDVDTSISTTTTLPTITVPSGILIDAILNFMSTSLTNIDILAYGLLSSPLRNVQTPTASNNNWFCNHDSNFYRNNYGSFNLEITTDDATIRVDFSTTNASISYYIRTTGFYDYNL